LLSGTKYGLFFDRLPASGKYSLAIGPSVLDDAGNAMDQNLNGVLGEEGDTFTGQFTVDVVGPRIVGQVPSGDISGQVYQIDLLFSEPMDRYSFSPSDVVITKPDGIPFQPWEIWSVRPVTDSRYRVSFSTQNTYGQYQVRVGPAISDLAGNPLDQDGNGRGGEPADVYQGAFNYVEMDLQVRNVSASATEVWAGDPLRVSWEVFNAYDTQLLGSWSDAVYLSQDDRWDYNDRWLASAWHDGGLAPKAAYSQSLDAQVPGVLPGDYYILVRTDAYNYQKEVREDNNVAAIGPIHVGVRELPADGTPVSGTVTATNRTRYYQVHANEGEPLLVSIDGKNDSAFLQMYVRRGAMPSDWQYDYRQRESFGADHQIVIPAGASATYYIMVYGSDLAGDSTDFTVRASTARTLTLLDVSPKSASKAGRVTVKLVGANFPDAATVELMSQDGSLGIPAVETILAGGWQAWATFNLVGAPAGLYDLKMTEPSGASAVLDDAFTIVGGSGGGAKLVSRFIVPARVRLGQYVTAYSEISNQGDADGYVPVVWNVLPDGTQNRLNVLPPGLPMQTVPPGTTVRVPITFQARTLGLIPVEMKVFDLPDFGITEVGEYGLENLFGGLWVKEQWADNSLSGRGVVGSTWVHFELQGNQPILLGEPSNPSSTLG
jgi:hypothetical protein